MKPSAAVAEIQANPPRFVGDLEDGAGLHALAYELIALSAMEALRQPTPPQVSVTLLGPRRLRVADAGRGMAMHTEPGQTVSHAEHALTQFYPVSAPSEALRAFLAKWVWGERGSLGPVVANALAERLDVVSVRGSDRWSLSFARGEPLGPPERSDTTEPSGTRITLVPDPRVFGDASFDWPRLSAHVAWLQATFPQAQIQTLELPDEG